MKRRVVASFVILAVASACRNSTQGTSPSATSTHFQGTFAGTAGQSGTVDITIQSVVGAQASVWWPLDWMTVLYAATSTAATGTATLAGGGAATLAGTYDAATKGLDLSGGGYAFTGTATNATLAGTFTGPGAASGSFASLNATTVPVTVYCGTFQSHGGAESGTWNLEVSGSGSVSGIAFSTVPPAVLLSGQVTGGTLTLTTSDGGSGTGSIGNGLISGTGNNNTVFAGSTSACNLPTGSTAGGSGGTTPTSSKTYVGPFSGQINIGNFNSPGMVCATLFSFVGTMSVTLDQPAAATLSGTAQGTATDSVVTTGPCGRNGGGYVLTGTVGGTPGSLTMTGGMTNDANQSWSFSGSLSGNVISGTVARQWSQGIIFGSTTFTLSLR